MALSLTAFLNQRFQFTYDVPNYAELYSNLNSAVWRFQIRPAAGSVVVILDFASGGSPQDPHLTATYDAIHAQVAIRAPTSFIQNLPVGTYDFDFGFVLPGCDFERVDGGTITFLPGVTRAGVVGSPSAPSAADDTVFSSGNNAMPPAVNIYALSAAQEALTVSATNTLSALSHPWTGLFAFLTVRGGTYAPTGASPLSISGTSVTWNSSVAGFDLNTGDDVSIFYSK